MSSYQQPIKSDVRKRLLKQAIKSLTANRAESYIVRSNELNEVVNFALAKLKTAKLPNEFNQKFFTEYESWKDFYKARTEPVGIEKLKILYLCGPEPLNDLKILISLGVNIHNVWAVTSSASDLANAIEQIAKANIGLKIHHGSLSEFFEAFQETFDVIYIDACGPFAGGKPNTLTPILNVLANQRLSPLSALITTFSEIPTDDKSFTEYVEIMTAYFRYRYNDLPKDVHRSEIDPAESEYDPEQLRRYIKRNAGLMYSEFITKFIVELATYWIPACRALSLSELFTGYMGNKKDAKAGFGAATNWPEEPNSIEEFVKQAGHVVLSPSSYPILSFFDQLKQLDNVSLSTQLGNFKLNGYQMGELIGYVSLLDNVFEGHWDCLSEKLKRAVAMSWFDAKFSYGCDTPLPNLLVNSLLGLYGRPWFVNPRNSLRLRYRAKTNEMYCDMLIFDQCRYFFDWWPTLDLCPQRFKSLTFQILARCMIDRIGWHNWKTDVHPFRGGAFACMGEIDCAMPFDFKKRKYIKRPA
jgi:hypothetical protein